MSTFDASSPATEPAYASLAAGYNEPPGEVKHALPDFGRTVDAMPSRSTLDELRDAAAEEDPREPITVTNPRETIRLTLRTDIRQADVQRWSHKSLSREERQRLKRRGGNPNLSTLDPVVMFTSAIVETTIQVEVRSRATHEWVVVTDEHTGEPLTFEHAALRQVLGGLDATSAVKRAFNGSEPALLEAGQRLIDASGFGDEDTDDEDPTSAAG